MSAREFEGTLWSIVALRLRVARFLSSAVSGCALLMGRGLQIIEKEIPVHMPVERVVEIPVETTLYKVAWPTRKTGLVTQSR